ncbi:MAG: glycosyltransferase family 2 protein [Candidatus Shapirobacteria bacterium]|jgi:glycosyltransferase involved in cell wall biosynthesis
MKKISLSIIILAGNEEKIIKNCLKSCTWADEVVLVAANSTDSTVSISKQIIRDIVIVKTTDEYNKNFSKWRNLGYKKSKGDWIFYVDADEVVTQNLKDEILSTITNPSASYYVVPRANHYLGKRVYYGGSYPDYVKRLYYRPKFRGYTGYLHEEPIVSGSLGFLKHHLEHYTHRDLSSMLDKTVVWTDMEAKALLANNHPPVVWWRFLRMMFTKMWERLIKQQMWRDGNVGWISVIFEMYDTFIIYARLWELQQNDQKSSHL